MTAMCLVLKYFQICISYLDPALVGSRMDSLLSCYGFDCDCISCIAFKNMGSVPSAPEDSARRLEAVAALRDLIFPTGVPPVLPVNDSPTQQLEFMPAYLRFVFHESFIVFLSETFSEASHSGSYDLAMDTGISLLALYTLIYPPNYPQIGT